MKVHLILSAIVLAVPLAVIGCAGQTAAPTPTLAVTSVPAISTTAPSVPTKASAAPTAASTAVAKPAASPTAAAAAPASDLIAKAKTAGPYSVTINTTGQHTSSSKMYVNGTKMRVETSLAGQSSATTVMIIDTAAQTAYSINVARNTAMKVDTSQAPAPTTALPDNAKFSGNDTLDGKPAAIYDITTPTGSNRDWIWTDRGLPLRVQIATPEGTQTMDFVNYDFSQQPDSLFEVPAGMQVIQAPASNIPGLLTPQPKQ